ncbi:hypothetical protein ES703_122292 [subsurface metagenome]
MVLEERLNMAVGLAEEQTMVRLVKREAILLMVVAVVEEELVRYLVLHLLVALEVPVGKQQEALGGQQEEVQARLELMLLQIISAVAEEVGEASRIGLEVLGEMVALPVVGLVEEDLESLLEVLVELVEEAK